MPRERRKLSLIYLIILTLLLVGLFPLVLTGWFLSEKSGRELRAAENRYQIQLVQEKAKQIEIFGRRYTNLLSSLTTALELSNTTSILSAPQTEQKLGALLRDNPDLLALQLRPVGAEALSLFRKEAIGPKDRATVTEALNIEKQANIINISGPRQLESNGDMVLTFGSRVDVNGAKAADIVAVVSLRDINRSVVGMGPTKEQDLWKSGLPMVFVVDKSGDTVFHADPAVVSERRDLGNLKIVNEWLESGAKVQSALVPFRASFEGIDANMIGAYSTARISEEVSFGVFTMQDEGKALASVGEMRTQTWIISMAFAMLALVVGFIGARLMSTPLMNLVSAAKKLGAGDYSTRVKTSNLAEIGTLAETFNLMSGQIEDHIAKLAKAAQDNRELFVGTVKALAAAIDGKDKYTRGHSERVSRISVAIGRRLGMESEELETLRISALLHDVGKIGIDDAILKKPAALTDEEFAIMKTHPMKGYKIMSQIPAMKDFLPGMVMHHEMVNGMGYPRGLKGDEIPLQAKIISVADTFDAMTIDRPYQKGMELQPALDRLRSFVGTRYASEVVEALIQACSAGEVANGIVRQMAAIRAAENNEKARLEAVAV